MSAESRTAPEWSRRVHDVGPVLSALRGPVRSPRKAPRSEDDVARHRFVLALGVVTLAVLSPLASGEEPPAPAPAPPPSLPGGPPPDSPDMPTGPARLAWRDSTWPAADAEGWKKPVLLKFQR